MQIVKQAYAQTDVWVDINENCVNNGVATVQGLGCMLSNMLSVALTLLGIAGFIMIIYAAFNLMLMGGNSQATEKSRNTITFAVIAIIVALSAFIVINLISDFTGVEAIKNFFIPGSGKNWMGGTSAPPPETP